MVICLDLNKTKMPEQLSDPKPETLYRGITIPAAAVTEEIFTGEIHPGEEPIINEHGEKVVADGNEYGVYMSDNAHMSEVAYATPRRGDSVPDSPKFNWKGASQSTVTTPRVGVLYEIDASDLDVRKPKITHNLEGHYNNGFQGDEWIADSIPAGSHKVTKLTLGPDTLHEAREFPLDGGHTEAIEALREEVAHRAGRLATAAALINEIPGSRRHFPGMVERDLAKADLIRAAS
jgi:hypothetical protein